MTPKWCSPFVYWNRWTAKNWHLHLSLVDTRIIHAMHGDFELLHRLTHPVLEYATITVARRARLRVFDFLTSGEISDPVAFDMRSDGFSASRMSP